MIYLALFLFILWNGYANKVKVYKLWEDSDASKAYHFVGRCIYAAVGCIGILWILNEYVNWFAYIVNPLDLLIAWQGALLTGFLILWMSYFLHNAIIGKIMVGDWRYVESNRRMTRAYVFAMFGTLGLWIGGLIYAIASKLPEGLHESWEGIL